MADNKTMAIEVPAGFGEVGDSTEAVLVQLYPPGPNLGRRFTLAGPEHIVGRLPENDVSLEEDGVSRQHARVKRASDQWVLEDMGSTNGSYINDQRIDRRPLKDGDTLRFGTAVLRFLMGSNVEAAYHEVLHKMTILDGLTGVHNKRHLLEFLDRELSRARRQGSAMTLLLFDIDFFKKVNDVHGHLAGDAVLKELCRRLEPEIRREDLLARYGGEEFAVVLVTTSLTHGAEFAEELRVKIAAMPFQIDRLSLPVTVSIGVAEIDPTILTVDDLIARADAKLYAAKHAGRNRVIS